MSDEPGLGQRSGGATRRWQWVGTGGARMGDGSSVDTGSGVDESGQREDVPLQRG